MYSLVLNFPFKINKIKTQHIYKTKIERKENLISFALNWRYPITIEDATCLSISNENDLFLYVFQFEEINRAIDFMENTSVDVQRILEFTEVEKLVDKTDKLMIEYEKNEKGFKRNKKKKLVEDYDGFMRYEPTKRNIKD